MDFQKLSKEYEQLAENLRAAEEFDKLAKENPEHLKQILLEGMKTEFWKYFKGLITRTMFSMEQNLKGKAVQTFDDLVVLGKFNTIYKQTDELINFPENFLKSLLKIQEQNKAKKS